MEHQTIDLYQELKNINSNVFKHMSIQELFDLRHDMLTLKHMLGEFLDVEN